MITRRKLLAAGLCGGIGAFAPPLIGVGRCSVPGTDVAVSTRAADLVLGSTVIDMLGLLTLDWHKLFRWQNGHGAFREPDYRQLELSGIKIFHPAVETAQPDPVAGVTHWLEGWRRLVASTACFLRPVGAPSDLDRSASHGRIGLVVGFQNSSHFLHVDDVARFYALGQRVSQLTYNEANKLGSGCYETRDRGLTAFGGSIVREMNRVGMAIDISHCGPRTSLEAIAASRQPVLATHANCRALVPAQPRGKSDQVIKALAARGGVMGITVVRAFVARSLAPTLDDLLDHFDHVARLVGVEHVGLGSDADITTIDPATGRTNTFYSIRGLDPVARVFQIADGLLRRGYSAADVELVLGGNFRRALSAIWREPPTAAAALETRRDPFCPAPYPRVPRISRKG